MHKLLTPSLLICALSACSTTQTTKNSQIAAPQTISAAQSQVEPIAPALQAIIDQSWQLQLSASPEMAYSMGDAVPQES